MKKILSLMDEYYNYTYNNNAKKDVYLSESYHYEFFYNKQNYKYAFDILNSLQHFRIIDDNTKIPLSCPENVDLNLTTIGFYNNLKTIISRIKIHDNCS
jgi:hypothetical protein